MWYEALDQAQGEWGWEAVSRLTWPCSLPSPSPSEREREGEGEGEGRALLKELRPLAAP